MKHLVLNPDMPEAKWVICKFCDSVYQRAPLAPREAARCSACGADLYHAQAVSLDAMLALTIAGIFAFIVANLYPIAALEVQGRHSESTLWGAIIAALNSNAAPIGALAAMTAFVFPLMQLCLFAYVLVPLRQKKIPRGFRLVMHTLRQMHPWVMVEVFMLGVLVAVVKLGDVATVTPRAGCWGLVFLTLLITVLNACNLHELWDRASALEA